MVDLLPSTHKALGSIPAPPNGYLKQYHKMLKCNKLLGGICILAPYFSVCFTTSLNSYVFIRHTK
jgi:hypothetical protein